MPLTKHVVSVSLLLYLICYANSLAAIRSAPEIDTNVSRINFISMSKEQKYNWTNVGGIALITTWGVINWDYGQRSPNTQSEGWFGENTKTGGADKFGHFSMAYGLSHFLADIYQQWGYSFEEAAYKGAVSSFGLMSFMELGDAFSTFGFSHEDFIMNSLGSYVGYRIYQNPQLAKTIDFRVEYIPDLDHEDIFTDYEHTKYLIALKFEGFIPSRFILSQSNYLKYLEIQWGWYSRGYIDNEAINKRVTYIALGLNFSSLIRANYPRLAKMLNYYQVPWVYLSHEKNLNQN